MMSPIRTLLTKAVVLVITGAVICQGASSADAATAAPAHPCQPHANVLGQLNQLAAAHNARAGSIDRRQPAQVEAYSAEANRGNAAGQRAVSSLRLCLQQVQAAEAQARQQAAEARQRAEAQARQQAAEAHEGLQEQYQDLLEWYHDLLEWYHDLLEWADQNKSTDSHDA
jgi:hypothetical protein